MTKPVKIAVGLIGSLLLLVIIVLVVAFVFIDSIAKTGIEKGATFALGVNTTLDKASVGILSGQFSMNGLKVDNPKGFDGKFLDLGKGGVAVSLASLTSDTVVLPKLDLADMQLDLARNSSGANYKIIMDNLQRLESGSKPSEPATSGGKKFKISEISITNVNVHLDLVGGPGGLTKLDVPIQEIKLTNVGSDGSGVDMSKLTSIILEAVLKAAVDKGGNLIPSDIAGELQNGLSRLSGLSNVGVEAVGKLGEKATKLGGQIEKDLQKGVGGSADQLKKGLGDLMPGSKDSPPKK
jgi:hypothetical protein